MNHYETLNVARDASPKDIQKKYRQLARMMHPDTAGEGGSHFFVLINAAYEVLSNPAKRAAYDAQLDAGAVGEGADNGSDGDGYEFGWGEGAPMSDDSSRSDYGQAYGDAYEEGDEYDSSTQGDYSYGDSSPYSEGREHGRGRGEEALDENVMPSAVVDDSRLAWKHRQYAPLSFPVPAGRVKRIGSMVVYLLACVLLVGYVALVKDSVFATVVTAFVVTYCGSVYMRSASDASARWYIHLLVTALIGFYSLVDLGLAGSGRSFGELVGDAGVFFFYTVAAAYAGRVWRKWRQLVTVVPGRYVPAYVVAQGSRVDGVPGEGLLSAVDKFGENRVNKGVVGEQMTAELLERLLVIPGVYILHGLRFPGTANADIDHAVICGDRVALIDSKAWAPGNYTWGPFGEVLRDGGRGSAYTVHFPAAVDMMREIVPSAQVEGWIVVHRNRGGQLSTPVYPEGPSRVRLVDAQKLLEEVGGWLSAGTPSGIDPYAFAELRAQKN